MPITITPTAVFTNHAEFNLNPNMPVVILIILIVSSPNAVFYARNVHVSLTVTIVLQRMPSLNQKMNKSAASGLSDLSKASMLLRSLLVNQNRLYMLHFFLNLLYLQMS